MKKIVYRITLLVVAFASFVSCSKQDDVEVLTDSSRIVHVTMSKGVDTKTAVVEGTNEASYVWTTGDEAYVHIYENGKKGTIINANYSSDFKTASFDVEFTETTDAPYTYKAIYAKEVSSSYNPFVQANQNPTLTSFDPAADVMISKEINQASQAESLVFTMGRVITVNKFIFNNLTRSGASNEKVQSVEITMGKSIAGGTYAINTGNYSNASKKITLNYINGAAITDGSFTAYFTAYPVVDATIESITIKTDQSVYTRTDFGNPRKALTLAIGTMKRLTVNMSGTGSEITEGIVYTLVENQASFVSGAKYIIVGNNAKAMAAQTNNNRAVVDVTPSNGTITIDNTIEASVFQIDFDGTNYIIKDVTEGSSTVNYYLYAAGANTSNYLRSKDVIDALTHWNISINNGIASIENLGNTSRGTMCYNQSNNIISCYSSSSASSYKTLALYVDQSSAIPTLETPSIETSVNGRTITVEWEDVTGASSYLVTCSDQANQIIEPGVQEATFTVQNDGTYTVSVTAISSDHSTANDSAPANKTVKIGYDFTTVAQLNGLATSTATEYSGYLTNAIVSFVPGTQDAIIKDATGSILLHKSGHTLLQGQTFTGEITVTSVLFHNCAQITELDASFTGDQTTVAPVTMTLATLSGNLSTYQNAYVKVEDLEVTAIASDNKTISVKNANDTYVVYANTGLSSNLIIGDIITAVGTITWYNNKDQIKVWSSDDITVTSHGTVTTLSIAEVIAASVGTAVETSGVVAQINQKGFILTDGNNNILVYQNAAATVAVGQAVTVKGSRAAYNNIAQISSPTITPGATGQTVTRTTLVTVTSSNANEYTTSEYVSLTGTLTITGSYYNVSIAGTTVKGSLAYLSGSETFTAGSISSLNGKAITVTGYVTGSTNSYLSIAPVDIELDHTPSLSVTPSSLNWSATEYGSTYSKTITVTVNESAGYTVTGTNNNWTVSDNGNGTITVYPNTANTSTANDRTMTLTITHNSESSLSEQVVCKQNKSGAVSATYTLTFPDDNSASNGISSYNKTWTAKSGTQEWSISNFNNNNWNNDWTYIKCGSKSAASVATIVTADIIEEAIKTVTITIDALTASKINSIILYTSSNGTSWTQEGSFTKATGNQSVTISTPSANKYYKLEFDCSQGSSNGLLTLSKVVYTTD
ncbi:MAG: hypothetical protein IKH89_03905 [Bacteroidales bacterium]|nr:hypothetical protein [Bacteroidales bacterium]